MIAPRERRCQQEKSPVPYPPQHVISRPGSSPNLCLTPLARSIEGGSNSNGYERLLIQKRKTRGEKGNFPFSPLIKKDD
jgi:hypothetical protein